MDIIPSLSAYGSYILHYPYVIDLIEKGRKRNSKLLSFLSQTCKNTKHIVYGLQLEDILASLVNHLPQYKYYLDKLLEATPVAHTSYDALLGSYAVMQCAYRYIQECYGVTNQFCVLLEKERKISGLTSKVIIPNPSIYPLPLAPLCHFFIRFLRLQLLVNLNDIL